MQDITPRLTMIRLLQHNHPRAMAWIRGGSQFPKISGLVKFYDTSYGGTLVEAEIFGLPDIATDTSDFYAMHIHETGDCSQNFTRTGEHYNPAEETHPKHAGDMPPLLSNQGYAWTAFFDRRFTVDQVLDRSVVIHQMADDFHSQPSGNSGMKIGCGVIRQP